MTAERRGRLRPFLDALVERYHHPALLGTDPLAAVHAMPDPLDREIGGLFAALLAYGNVKQIRRSLALLFAAMGNRPGRFVARFDHAAAAAALGGFRHRFTGAEDVLCLCHLLNRALDGGASLEPFFLRGCRDDEPDLAAAAGRFVDNLRGLDFGPHFDRDAMLARASFKHLLPHAAGGSACKRVHLWLRWMVRPADGIDLGLWRAVPASRLLVPVDTHILRIARNLGLTRRATHSLAAAREITAVLRSVRPDDPVLYDFALCRLGILQACPTRGNPAACAPCELRAVCSEHARIARRAGAPRPAE